MSRSWRVSLTQVGILATGFVAWVLVTAFELIPPIMLAGPWAMLKAIWAGFESGELLGALSVTATEVAVAFAIGASVGLAIGLGGGRWGYGREGLYPVLIGLSSVPVFILFPLFVVWFGVGQASKSAFGAVYAFFPVVLHTFAAVRSVDRKFILKAVALGARPIQIYWKVVMPAALPTLVVGMRIGLIYAFIGVVATEMISAYGGLGYWLSWYAFTFAADRTYGYILVAVLCASLLNSTFRLIERRVGRWRWAA